MSEPQSSWPEFERVRLLAADLASVTTGTSYGTPALKVADKTFARMKDTGILVLMCPLEDKQLLLEAAPDIYFETDHYRGWPALLVRLDAIDDVELAHRLRLSWRFKAPKRLLRDMP